MKKLSLFTSLFLLIFFSGCTIMDGSAIVTGSKRLPLTSSEVKVYRTSPTENFEEIAIVSASAGHDFQNSSTLLNAAIERLKEEAAKVGANGVVLTDIKERDNPTTVTSIGNTTIYGKQGGAFATGTAIGINRGDAHTRLRGVAIFIAK